MITIYKPSKAFKTQEGINLNYHIKGKGESVVLFLHGFGLNIFSWRKFLTEEVDENFTYIFVDLKGFGFSDKPYKSDYSIGEQTQLVVQLLSFLKIKKLSLVCHSYGGIIALSLINDCIHKRNNFIIEKIVLINVPAFKDIRPNFIRILQNKILSFFIMNFLPVEIITRYTLKTTFYNYPESKRKHFNRYSYFFRQKGIFNSMAKSAVQIIPKNIDEIENCLSMIENEVLIIWGQNDYLIPVKNGEKLHKNIPNSTFKVIGKCGHVPHEEKSCETNQIIKNFLINDF